MKSYLALFEKEHFLELTLSRVAQRKRAGPITQRSEDRNLPLLCTKSRGNIPAEAKFLWLKISSDTT